MNRFLRPSLALCLVAAAAFAQPRASFLHSAPSQASPGQALLVEGTLNAGPQVDRLVLRYRGPGEDYVERRMELQYGDLYRASIPANQLVPPGVEYYVEAITYDAERVAVFMSAGRPARVLVLGSGGGKDPVRERPKEPASRPDPEPPPRRAPPPPDEEPTARGRERDREKPPAPLSELEEELALYSAEDTVALATRHEEKVTKVPSIATSYTREQIRALGARSVYDVLDVLPGISVSRDVQGFFRTAIRGLRSDPEVLFLLDGHPLNSFFDGKALANLPVENLERIDVILGPGSTRQGAGAFLGVVNLVTNREEGVRAVAGGGMFQTVDGHLSAAKSFGGLKIFADGDFLNQAGYQKPIAVDALEKDTRAQGMREQLEPVGKTNDARRLISAGAGMAYESASAGKVGVSARYLNEERAALIGLFDAVGEDSKLTWQVLQGDLNYERAVGDTGKFRLRAYFDDQSTRRLFQLTPENFKTGAADDQFFRPGLLEVATVGVRSFGGEAGADLQLAQTNRLTFGATVEQQSLYVYSYETNYTSENRYLSRFTRPDGLVYPQERGAGAATSRLNLGLYAQDQWTVVDRLTLTFGFRADATQLPQLDPQKQIIGKALVPSLNPRAGLVLAATDGLVFKLLYARAFRAPTVQELTESIPNTTYNQGRFAGNAALQPATVDSVELGGDLVQSAGGARVRLRGSLFYQSFTSPIALVDTSGNIVPRHNRTGMRILGAEGEARLEVSRRADAWVNASWFRAEDLDAPSQFRLLTDTPQARFNAGLSMPLGDYLNLDFVARIGAERRNNSRSVLELIRRYKIPAYALITAGLRTEPLAEHFEVALVAHNLFDQEVSDDVPRPDRMTSLLPREGVGAFLTVRASY